MVHVIMTKDILDRPPKIAGLFTRRQLIGVAAAVAVGAVMIAVIPLDLAYRFLLSLIPAIPILAIAFTPPGDMSPMMVVKFSVRKFVFGNDVYVNDGDTKYYKEKPETQEKIKRYSHYRGVR